MAEYIKAEVKEVTHHIALSQSELNTISLLLGHSDDELIIDRAQDHDVKTYCTGSDLDKLYNFFHSKRTED